MNSRSVLVLDTPATCGDCPLSVLEEVGDSWGFSCDAFRCTSLDKIVDEDSKDSGCPLVKIPKYVLEYVVEEFSIRGRS